MLPRFAFAAAVLCVSLTGCGSQTPPSASQTSTFDVQQYELENEVMTQELETQRLREQLAQEQQASRGAQSPAAPAARSATSDTSRTSGARAGALLSAADRRSFAALERSLGGPAGVAIASGETVSVTGTLRGGPAWSTIKVPLTIAAGRAGDTQNARLAITASDNAAAARMWRSLGAGRTAAAAVQHVLADGGDRRTRVQAQQTRPPFSAFGQTSWRLSDQAQFFAQLECVQGSEQTLQHMRQVVADQRWGLGQLDGDVRFKGGWGPGTSGGYVARQAAVIDRDGRPLAVAAIARGADMQAAVRMLDQITAWVGEHMPAQLRAQPSC